MTRMRYVHTEWTGEHFILISPLSHTSCAMEKIHTCIYMYAMYMYAMYKYMYIHFF